MSSDPEDYDGDTNWADIAVTVGEVLSQQRRRVETVSEEVATTTAEPERTAEAAISNQSNTESTSVSVSTTVRQGSSSSSAAGAQTNNSSRRQAAILSALSFDRDLNTQGNQNTLSKGKRKRSSEELDSASNTKRHVVNSSSSIQKPSVYDDELSCPICLDFFLCPQLLNPCGHTVCGDCLNHWLGKSDSRKCPTCRTRLSYTQPQLPNFAIKNMVDKYIELQRANKDNEWLDGGAKWKERQTRRRTYEIVEQMNETKPTVPPPLNWGRLEGARVMLEENEARLQALSNIIAGQRPTFTRIEAAPPSAAAPESFASFRARMSRPITGLPPYAFRFAASDTAPRRVEPSNRATRRRTSTASTTATSVIEISSDDDSVAGEPQDADENPLRRVLRETEAFISDMEREWSDEDEGVLVRTRAGT